MYDNIWRDAFLKALTPALIMILALAASLTPLYIVGQTYRQITKDYQQQ
jgi:hypothetical protein